jgi:uncharacterized repeat protein (TIGR03803 family)
MKLLSPALRTQQFVFKHAKVLSKLVMAVFFCFSLSLTLLSQPFLWGLTEGGGCNDAGSLFEYNVATRTSISLHDFNFTNNGYSPEGGLLNYGGKFYGMCASGGNYNLGDQDDVFNYVWKGGVIFRFDPNGGQYDVLHHFDIVDGSLPSGDLIEYGGKLYGMTPHGGANNQGVLFEYDLSDGMYTVLHHFTTLSGAHPYASLMESNGNLYGTTTQGGIAGGGVIFKYEVNSGTYSVLYHFTVGGGFASQGNLLALGTNFYGLTKNGGINGKGVIFKYNPITNVYSVVHAFSGIDGANPLGTLIENNGKLYGTASIGGAYNMGTLFEYDLSGAGTYAVLHSFNFFDGTYPTGTLLAYIGRLFGLIIQGGAQDMGELYEYNLATSVFSKMDFTGLNGAYPLYGKLIVGPQCQNCEVDDDGVNYACDNCPEIWNPDQADCDNDGVGDVCDLCPGSDDSIDSNHDGIADCHLFPGYENVPDEWLCSNNTNSTKIKICHHGQTLCVSVNAIPAHIAHGDYIGPCNNSPCDGQNFNLRIDHRSFNITQESFTHASMNVFPNPTNGEINITLEGIEGKLVQLSMYDPLGKQVWNSQLTEGNSFYHFNVDDKNIGNGVYLVWLQTGNETYTERILVNR